MLLHTIYSGNVQSRKVWEGKIPCLPPYKSRHTCPKNKSYLPCLRAKMHHHHHVPPSTYHHVITVHKTPSVPPSKVYLPVCSDQARFGELGKGNTELRFWVHIETNLHNCNHPIAGIVGHGGTYLHNCNRPGTALGLYIRMENYRLWLGIHSYHMHVMLGCSPCKHLQNLRICWRMAGNHYHNHGFYHPQPLSLAKHHEPYEPSLINNAPHCARPHETSSSRSRHRPATRHPGR